METGTDYRGPQDPAVICPASGPNAPPQPPRCDDTEYGNGAGGQLSYRVKLRAGRGPHGLVRRRRIDLGCRRTPGPSCGRPWPIPAGRLESKIAARREGRRRQRRRPCPATRCCGQRRPGPSRCWPPPMQRVEDPQLRVVNAGKAYPAPHGTLKSMRWLGAGWPDYTWLFGTDGEYTAFAAVAAGQFEPIKAHLRALRDVSEAVNGGSGKIVHEVTPDGAVYFGANADPGNTDESSKYPSAVALVWRWTGDRAFLHDLYPASVERDASTSRRSTPTMTAGPRGWATSSGPGWARRSWTTRSTPSAATPTWPTWPEPAATGRPGAGPPGRPRSCSTSSRRPGGTAATPESYADSLDDPGNVKVFQRHWIGLTPTDAVLPQLPGRPLGAAGVREHANATLDQHEQPCYTGELGLFHTGTGPTSAPGGNPGASCDSVVSAVPSERSIFTLNSAIAAVSEGNYGRLGAGPAGRLHRRQRPGPARPEHLGDARRDAGDRARARDFGANIDRLFTERSMVMQAWGAYGVLWPVVHQWLGVSPDLGGAGWPWCRRCRPARPRRRPTKIKLGLFSIDVAAEHRARATHHGHPARPDGPDHRRRAAGRAEDRLGHARRVTGEAQAGEDNARA